MKDKIGNVFRAFNHNTSANKIIEFNSGHINDTYLIKTEQGTDFVLQRINSVVFKNIPALVENKVKVSQHLASKLEGVEPVEKLRRVLTFVPATSGVYYYKDIEGGYWNLSYYVSDSVSFETVNNKEIAYEGGKLFGTFINQTNDFNVTELVDVLPGFHNVKLRLEQFEKAKSSASQERLLNSKCAIERVTELKEEMVILQNLADSGDIPFRVTHNDTKISNALFDKQNKGLCVIDTDTVMPGIVHNDFGDAIRTICNTAEEDQKDLSLVHFNVHFYEAYLKGFIEELKDSLNQLEIKYLPLGAKTIIYIMGLRFLTDYLQGDIYYKTFYDEHNLTRCKNQLKLIDSFEQQYDTIHAISDSVFKREA